MSITYVLVGAGNGIGGLVLDRTGPRWIWGACGGLLLVAAVAGRLLARRLGTETPAEAEHVRPSDSTVVAAN
jgi:predicted MFS family arabinose efflux permease